jgi:hypothetical protein
MIICKICKREMIVHEIENSKMSYCQCLHCQ